MLECVVNVSEGRRADVLARLAAACGPALLDIHADGDHHRSVFTLAGEGDGTEDAAHALLEAAAAEVDLVGHRGVHPRLGAVDVVPFVALDGSDPADAAAAAVRFGRSAAERWDLPVFLYDGADPERRTLPSVRRDAFRGRSPDFGPPREHPRLGAVAVGARPVLVAVNCDLAEPDLDAAREIARAVRERDGGLPGIRALGFMLASRGQAQVSMNLVDLAATSLEAACTAVRAEAQRRGVQVTAVELVGLVPGAELRRCSRAFLEWAGLGPELTIEARLAASRSSPSPTDLQAGG
jgi:glutamate formiminotransferase / 5-formyltetrahydrofolate cyclo-ligase